MRKILAVAVLALAACAPIGEFSKRASFELQCPEDKLTFTNLQESGESRRNRQTWGVRGCGKQATYQKTASGWSKAEEKQAPSEPQPQQTKVQTTKLPPSNNVYEFNDERAGSCERAPFLRSACLALSHGRAKSDVL